MNERKKERKDSYEQGHLTRKNGLIESNNVTFYVTKSVTHVTLEDILTRNTSCATYIHSIITSKELTYTNLAALIYKYAHSFAHMLEGP